MQNLVKIETKYLKSLGKATHNYHLVTPSPWPLITSQATLFLAITGTAYMRFYPSCCLFNSNLFFYNSVVFLAMTEIVPSDTQLDGLIGISLITIGILGFLLLSNLKKSNDTDTPKCKEPSCSNNCSNINIADQVGLNIHFVYVISNYFLCIDRIKKTYFFVSKNEISFLSERVKITQNQK